MRGHHGQDASRPPHQQSAHASEWGSSRKSQAIRLGIAQSRYSTLRRVFSQRAAVTHNPTCGQRTAQRNCTQRAQEWRQGWGGRAGRRRKVRGQEEEGIWAPGVIVLARQLGELVEGKTAQCLGRVECRRAVLGLCARAQNPFDNRCTQWTQCATAFLGGRLPVHLSLSASVGHHASRLEALGTSGTGLALALSA